MKKKTILVIGLCFFFLSGGWCQTESQITDQENLKQKNMENYLRTAKVTSDIVDPGAGRTGGWIIDLDDGKTARQGYFKHANRSRPTLLPDSYKYEIAAYELNKLLNLNIVPPVVEREIKGIKGSIQLFIEDFTKESDRKRRKITPPDPESFQNTLEEIIIFENLVYDECCDADDIFIQNKDWKVWRVDFSEAFAPVSELIPSCKITRCSKKLFQNLKKLDCDEVKNGLKQYLNDEEIKALLNRKNILIEKIKPLIEKEGKESIPFS